MDTDFPAAHSMDVEWFAVDAQGSVAVFQTGEDGHQLLNSYGDQGALWEFWRFFHPEVGDDDDEQHDAFGADPLAAAAKIGLFCYAYGNEFDPIGTYGRMGVPAVPLHIDQLPPEMRREYGFFCFRTLNFAETT